MELTQSLRAICKGEVYDDVETLQKYSRDASIFEVRPAVVVYPHDAQDIAAIVKFVANEKPRHPELSITVRAAGTCMSGGSLNESIIIDVTRHMHGVSNITRTSDGGRATVLPGTFYRDFEKAVAAYDLLLPTYTASKELCAIGGMIGNNAAGEKTLRYGKTERYIESLKIILRDGYEYTITPLSKRELYNAIATPGPLGELYQSLYTLITENWTTISAAKPNVSKNSAGYYLWNVWDPKTEIFDLGKLIVGSQGTLGIVTEATLRLVPIKHHTAMTVFFLPQLQQLGAFINEILPFQPESIESYDDYSLKLAVRFFPDFFASMGVQDFIRLGISFLPEVRMILRGGIPKMVLIVEFAGVTVEEAQQKAQALQKHVASFGYPSRVVDKKGAEKYWRIRRESFNLLRKHVKGKHTAPFIDDICVRPEVYPEFLPKLTALLNQYHLVYTIAGHAGDGNFHIIPLMDFKDPQTKEIILELSDRVYDLVTQYGGTITAEHNDGIIRTPYLERMYGPEVIRLFREVKALFDPLGIFNPGKKVGGTKEYLAQHIITEKCTTKHCS